MSQSLRNLRVATKLSAGFGVVCILLVVVIGAATARLAAAQASLADLYSGNMAAVGAADDVKSNFLQANQDLADIALAKDDASTAAATAAMQTDQAELVAAWATYQGAKPSAPAGLRQQTEDLLGKHSAARLGGLDAAQLVDPATFIAYRAASVTPLTTQVLDVLDQLAGAEDVAAAVDASSLARAMSARSWLAFRRSDRTSSTAPTAAMFPE